MFSMFFYLIFGAVAVIIIISLVKGVSQWSYNNKQPVLTVSSRVVSKRTHVSHHHNNNNGEFHNTSSTTYYITFEVESGDRMEFKVDGREFGQLAEGDQGMLKFQGTRYYGYERLHRGAAPQSSQEKYHREM
ncbi:DUF2500 domain-containing protein [Paenibacillus selenitireducens]|nr:DUF2500 domain-containing protein [Paenibacillus selenitireducens]